MRLMAQAPSIGEFRRTWIAARYPSFCASGTRVVHAQIDH